MSSFAEFSKSVSSSAFETSKSVGSSVADVSIKAKDATVSAVGKTVETASRVATKTKDSLLSIELPKRKIDDSSAASSRTTTTTKKKIMQRTPKKGATTTKQRRGQKEEDKNNATRKTTTKKKKKNDVSIEKLKPPQKKTTTIQTKKDKKKIKKNQKTDAAAAAETGGPLFSLAKAKTLMNDKVGSAVQFATTNVRPPSISVTNSNLSPAAIQQTALYVSSFLLVAYTSSRVRKNRRARAQKRAEQEIRLAADRERQKQRWTRAIAQNPDSSQLLGNRTSKTAKTITTTAAGAAKGRNVVNDDLDEVRKANDFGAATTTNKSNESGWDEKEYEKMNKEYRQFLKDSRLPKRKRR